MRISDWSSDVCSSDLLDRFAPELRCHHVLELELLLGGEREELVGRLLRLERSFGTLAARDDVGERLGVGLDVLDDLRLHGHGLAECTHAGIEPRAGRSEAPTSELQSLMRHSYA